MKSSLKGDVRYIKGVGFQIAKKLNQIGIHTVEDIFFHIPRTYLEREYCCSIDRMEINKRYKAILQLKSIGKAQYKSKRIPLKALFTDGKASLDAVWFNYQFWQIADLKPGVTVILEGEVKQYGKKKQMVHPVFEIIETESQDYQLYESFEQDEKLLPIYPLTADLTQNLLRKIILNAWNENRHLISETVPGYIRDKYSLPTLQQSIANLHFPQTKQEAEIARKRLVFEELFYHQLMLARSYHKKRSETKGISFSIKKKNTTKLKNSLPFDLTTAQKRVLREIVGDMESSRRMNRLLQGDVGSGKTIVALFAMLLAVENGYQAVMLVPTEILAKQHYQTISSLIKEQPEIRTVLILGGNRKGTKDALQEITAGSSQLIIGTHALLEDKVVFRNAGLIVIDEQQRFGVRQRAVLPAKASPKATRQTTPNLFPKQGDPDILYLSATPIPRSLALTFYGDLDISVLDELPPYRKRVKTVWKRANNKAEVYRKIPDFVKKGNQIYIVCPLISETEKLDLLDAERLYQHLKEKVYPQFRIDLIHSRMKAAEKEAIMRRFQNKGTDILVSTTVIEVGVDIPNATVMIIEHAERFGLSQLHQLRGRVGRGSEESYCFLIAYNPLSETARQRLKIMTETNDGFLIAEKDLEIRGPGEFFGTSQSGVPLFRFSDPAGDMEILKEARGEARDIVLTDYELQKPQNRVIKERYQTAYRTKEELFSY